MGTLREALDRLEEAKVLLSEAIRNDLGIEPQRIDKIAVRVNNEREFKVLMEHYDSLGWQWIGGESPMNFTPTLAKYPFQIWYLDKFYIDAMKAADAVDFDFFCAQHGLSVPKFVLRSEDGVDLYEGDKLFEVTQNTIIDSHDYLKWHLVNADSGNGFWICDDNKNCRWRLEEDNKYHSKAFSTKEAAEKWIEDQKLMFTDVLLFRKGHYALVYKDQIELNGDGVSFVIKPSDIEEITRVLTKINRGQ